MTETKDLNYAIELDRNDPLNSYRQKFHLPVRENGEQYLYFCGNSLGLQPKSTSEFVNQELEDWKMLGVEGHFRAKNPWMPYHEFLTNSLAKIVGAKPIEVVAMNALTVNLHLMMVSFYRPKGKRVKIMMEADAFPSDHYAVKSQLNFHGVSNEDGLILLKPREGEDTIRTEDILQIIEEQGETIALIMIGGVNYYTGQLFDMKTITSAGHSKGCTVGFDLAHAVGNVKLELHSWGVDFAVWCSYKYLNAGPGAVAGCFVNEKHASDSDLPRFSGWWGHDKESRFTMPDDFVPIPTTESWQLSNAPILSMASLRASLAIFEEVGVEKLNAKSIKLTQFLQDLILAIGDSRISIITPIDPNQRGCQLSIRIAEIGREVFEELEKLGVILDWREPDVLRLAPVPLYNSFEDVFRFIDLLKRILK